MTTYNIGSAARVLGEPDVQDMLDDQRKARNADDPDQIFADVTKSGYDRFISEYRPFENQLIERSQTDTTLVDAVAPTVQAQTDIAQGVARRNRERFGLAETGAMRRERMRATDRAQSLNLAGGLNNARVAQQQANQTLLADLINIGQGVNRSALSGLGAAAQNAVARENQYMQDRAAYKNSRDNMFASIIGGAMSFISDVRLKDNIQFSHKHGEYDVYTWDWTEEAYEVGVTDEPTIGVIAQDILQSKPEAVLKHNSGYLMVNYGAL
tara:strand:- start:6494 stop:7297 length:804 start_codon:yes stop_codon:yes gene_type:complete